MTPQEKSPRHKEPRKHKKKTRQPAAHSLVVTFKKSCWRSENFLRGSLKALGIWEGPRERGFEGQPLPSGKGRNVPEKWGKG